MKQYVCENVFIPLRSMPGHRSEMTSQVLFGEKYTIIDELPGWVKIELAFDGFSGWVDMDHIYHSPTDESDKGLVLNRSLLCYTPDGTKMVIEAGSEIYDPDFDNKTFRAGENIYKASPDFHSGYVTVNESFADTAMRFINSPYIWGGRVPSGIDCSGFTQLVYKIHGMSIPRNSRTQAVKGQVVEFIKDAKPGDLAFFGSARGQISHVGVILSEGLVIHASGRIRIDIIDHQGIYRKDIKAYSHKLRIIRRLTG